MWSDTLEYASRRPPSPWRRRAIVGALFALGVGVALAVVAGVLAVMEPNLLPHRI